MKLPERILNRITAVSITAKTLGMVTGVVFILGVAVMLQVRARLERELRADLETRGSPSPVPWQPVRPTRSRPGTIPCSGS